MFFSRKKVFVAAAVVAAAVVILVTQIGVSGTRQGAFKLEGAWIARVTTLQGVPGPYPFQWSYVLAPDASGRSASLLGSVDVGFPQNPQLPYDFSTPIIGELVQTRPDTAAFDSYWYAIRKGPINQIVYIGRSWGEVRFVEPEKAEVRHNFEIYLPDADTNGDGIPEGAPATTFSVTTIDTRIAPPLR